MFYCRNNYEGLKLAKNKFLPYIEQRFKKKCEKLTANDVKFSNGLNCENPGIAINNAPVLLAQLES